MAETFFTFFGVRGSYPVAGESVKIYGGNTTSLLLENKKDIVIFDAGTGIIKLGEYLKNERTDVKNINIFITHFHLDHLMGMSFFYPFSDKKYKINIYYPEVADLDVKSILLGLFDPPYSPIGKDGILAEIEFFGIELDKKKTISISKNIKIEYFYDILHPVHGVMLYKVKTQNKILVFATDIEPKNDKYSDELKEFIKNCDVLIHDSQYLDDDYYSKDTPTRGYGHSTFTMAVNNAIEANAKQLFLFHHNPVYSDRKLERILKDIKKKFKNTYLAKEYDKKLL